MVLRAQKNAVRAAYRTSCALGFRLSIPDGAAHGSGGASGGSARCWPDQHRSAGRGRSDLGGRVRPDMAAAPALPPYSEPPGRSGGQRLARFPRRNRSLSIGCTSRWALPRSE